MKVQEEFDAHMQSLGDALDRFPWEDRRAYAQWVAQTFYYVHHSTRLLALAAARFSLDEHGDALHQRFARHMREENRHEQLCLRDLAAMNTSMAAFDELSETRILYEPQYFKIEHVHPVSLLGYVLVLEVMSAKHGPRIFERSQVHPKGSTHFLDGHAREDPDHVEKDFAVLQGIPDAWMRHVSDNAEQTTVAYKAWLKAVAA